MDEITSFNALFAHASRRGVKLNSFHQLPDGKFACHWRIVGGATELCPMAIHERPFDAALGAFNVAVRILDCKPEMDEATPVVTDDLFS
jgi:hypothetical protein